MNGRPLLVSLDEPKTDRKGAIAVQKTHLSFAAFTDTHIGARYQDPFFDTADHLDQLGEDLVDATNQLDFVVHLGDIVNHNTAQVNGEGLPWFVNQYTNNLKAYLISHLNLPFYYVVGNHDVTDYQMNRGDPHNLTESLVDELSISTPVYAMMYEGILFLVVPELGYVTWTHPVEYEWIDYMTSQYPTTTTVILCHQAIEDTTEEESHAPYRGKQDMDWWATLFQNNPQIKMWIHGHNHYLDWYASNQSTGLTNAVRKFGHDMVFSSPYPQMDWYYHHELDRVVIYNISSTGITTASWENNGAGGHWVSEYLHAWTIPTTFNTTSENWYSFPVFLQDHETQLLDMKMLSPDITLQLIGTQPMELFFDARMESPNGSAKENILGFGNDQSGNVQWTHPGMRVYGSTTLTFPEKYPDNASVQEDGRSGQPYQSFPMGTISAAVPGQTYNFTITARCASGMGRLVLNVSCCDWITRSQYSVLPGSESQVVSHTFGSCYETIHGVYTVPDNKNAWFLQGSVEFLDSADYDVSLFSIKREQTSDTTDNFHLYLSSHWYNMTGSLGENEHINFSVTPQGLCDHDGVMNFTAFIEGNRYGMVNLVYREPLLMGMNARFRVNSEKDNVFNLSLTQTISRNSAEKMMIWDSALFQKFPHGTELFVRLLMNGAVGRVLYLILDKLNPGISTMFKMFPFSTDPMYEQVILTADDDSEVRHQSTNGNIWFSSNCPGSQERSLKVWLPSR
ncbi:MAG TPA: metallophosphoesterase [Candidatus Thermoplasmatota archaeon]|nr:metallophosphoesterase [Candidatus Thermoplasmatota archaeon]